MTPDHPASGVGADPSRPERAGVAARLRTRWRSLPLLVRDAVGAFVVLALFAVPLVVAPGTNPSSVMSVAALVVACAGLVWRRESPLVAAGAVLVATVASAAVDPESALALGPGLVAIYSVAAYARHVDAALLTGAMAVAYPAVLVLVGGMEATGSTVVLVVVLLVLAATLGFAIGAQRAVVAGARERAERAEESREAEAARRVTQERLRIARELHDVVAHHVAVISVQAGAAEALFDRRPEAAREAIGHVRDAGERVLAEMSSLLHLLREPDDRPDAAPAPGAASLPGLLDEVRATGLEVVERTSGSPRALPPVVDLTVYRVAQEALTNAHRYGTGRAEVSLVHGPGVVVLEVVNPLPVRTAGAGAGPTGAASGAGPAGAVAGGAGPAAAARGGAGGGARGSGLGLAGLRERVAAAGGTSEIGSRDRTWVVRVELPVPDGARSSDTVDPASPAAQEAP
ncbi:sensor histidine kinase [Oerskovia sp. NPDC057915]|uniref:sensor histidine kinase n=1 Tax=Oerskovia sp. NPDC057915 TaxID=3346280 RepID=UPI0036DA6618